MDLKEIKELETNKVHERLASLRAKVMKLRFAVSNRQLKNVRELRQIKREIAQLITILNQRRQVKTEDSK